jgi:glutathione S-transferase
MLKIYGVPLSRANRTLWMARELGLAFENVPIDFADGSAKTPEYLAINPNGRIPAIDDDGYRLWESMAINLYLAKKHGGPLAPANLGEEGLILQWSFWAMTEIEKPVVNVVINRGVIPGIPGDPKLADAAEAELARPFGVLDGHLAGREHLVSDRFTVADLNVAAVASLARMANVALDRWPNLARWLDRCTSRPAFAG